MDETNEDAIQDFLDHAFPTEKQLELRGDRSEECDNNNEAIESMFDANYEVIIKRRINV